MVLIPLLTYSTERDTVWVSRSVMLNTVILLHLMVRGKVPLLLKVGT